MKSCRIFGKSLSSAKKVVIRTTVLDLVSRLAEFAKDDAALVASVRRVLEGCNVRAVATLAPLRVVDSSDLSTRKARAVKIRTAWA